MTAFQQRNDKLGPLVVKALEARRFEAYYCATAQEALCKIMELIPADHTVAWGGSATMEQLGVIEAVRRERKVIDRETAKTPQEKVQMMREGLLSDTFLLGANALTEDGELYNIDSNGNRVAALTFGPKSVIVAVGMNKVVRGEAAAWERCRSIAAPVNMQRFGLNTPCTLTGRCADCKSADSICNVFVRTRLCKPAGRIKVVLVGENLGF